MTALYAVYCTVLVRLYGLLYGLLQVGLGFLALLACDDLTSASKDAPWHWAEVLALGFGLIIASFMCQLVGHARYEKYSAPPHLFHGFVAAPILEFVSLVFRLGGLKDTRVAVYATADKARESGTTLISKGDRN